MGIKQYNCVLNFNITMCKLIDFTAKLAEKFPWDNMEKEVDGTIFEYVFWEDENELFWVRLNEVLELYKEKNPLRCAEILDFIGRCGNWRCADEVSLAHYKNPSFAGSVLQYLESAGEQNMKFSMLQCLIVLDILFEAANQKNRQLYERGVKVMRLLKIDNISVVDAELERKYFRGYHYLWNNKQKYEAVGARFCLL